MKKLKLTAAQTKAALLSVKVEKLLKQFYMQGFVAACNVLEGQLRDPDTHFRSLLADWHERASSEKGAM